MSWEALRALEKEWRKESDDFERDGDEGTACAYYNCAEQLADILSSRQEVAPVARSSAEEFEFYVQAEIARAPAPLRELGDYLGRLLDEDQFATANKLMLQLATSYYEWVDGSPPRLLSKEEGEWFIAETTHGDRVVLKGLPEEYAYDFTTADSTYFKRDLIKRWRQFPDSDYKPLYTSTGQTSDARDVPSRETLAGLLAAMYYAQWATHDDKKRIESGIESALKNFNIGLNRFEESSHD